MRKNCYDIIVNRAGKVDLIRCTVSNFPPGSYTLYKSALAFYRVSHQHAGHQRIKDFLFVVSARPVVS